MRQIYMGAGFEDTNSSNTVQHTSPVAPVFRWGEDPHNGRHPWLCTSTFRNWQIFFHAPSDVDWTYGLYVNGVATNLAVTILEGAVYGENLTDVAAVLPEDTVEWRRTPNPGFGGQSVSYKPNIIYTLEADHRGAAISGYGGNGLSFMNGDGTFYTGLFAIDDLWIKTDSTLTNTLVIKEGGVVESYAVQLHDDPVALGGDSSVFAIDIDGVAQDGTGGTPDTRLTFTTDPSVQTWTGTLVVTDCQRAKLRCIQTGFSAGQGCAAAVAVRFRSNVPGTFWIGGNNGSTGSNSATQYIEPYSSNVNNDNWSSTEGLRSLHGSVTPLHTSGLCVWLQSNPGSGNSWSFRPRVAGEDGGQLVTIRDAQTSGSDALGGSTIRRGQTWSLQSVPTSNPAGAAMAWVMTGGLSPRIGPLAWVRVPRRIPGSPDTIVYDYWSDHDMQCPGDWYGGFKDGRVTRFS